MLSKRDRATVALAILTWIFIMMYLEFGKPDFAVLAVTCVGVAIASRRWLIDD